jgi:hypothetical protein
MLAGDHKRSTPKPRRPGELQWLVIKGSDRGTCELRKTRDVGCAAQLLTNGELVEGRLFPGRAQAMVWSDRQRTRLERQRWKREPGGSA